MPEHGAQICVRAPLNKRQKGYIQPSANELNWAQGPVKIWCPAPGARAPVSKKPFVGAREQI